MKGGKIFIILSLLMALAIPALAHHQPDHCPPGQAKQGLCDPAEEPTAEPTEEPTAEPTVEPTEEPTEEPTQEPTAEPTATPTAEPTEEPTEEPAVEYVMQYSRNADRTDPVALTSATVDGTIYAFLVPETDIEQVVFSLDGTAVQTENNPPFDFAGGDVNLANPFDTNNVENGAHTISALVKFVDGTEQTVDTDFTVENVVVEPTEEPTATPPPSGDKPGEHNTGPRTSLTVHDGSFTADTPGQVIEGLDIRGVLHIKAANVVVRDTRVASTAPYPIRMWDGGSATFEYIEVDGLESTKNNGCVYGGDLTIRYSEVHRCTDSAKVHSDSTWEFNYLHNNGQWGTDAHVDGLQTSAMHDVIVRGNTIDLPEYDSVNANIFFAAQRGPIYNVLLEDNWFNGGYYTVQILDGNYGVGDNVQVINNKFGREYRWGVLRLSDAVIHHGNVWEDTGEAID